MTGVTGKNTVDIEGIGSAKPATVLASVRSASQQKVRARITALESELRDSDELRRQVAERRQHVIDHLDEYLVAAEEAMTALGMKVHWASGAGDARRIVGEICEAAGARRIVKSKSMVTEEIHLNEHLENAGMEVVETDLGEFIVQLDKDQPSHIVTPIIHKDRAGVARTFEANGIAAYNEDPEALTMAARRFMRERFLNADCGITGANFIVAETGRLVTVSNEGNLRLTANAPRLHIAVTGIEKVVATEADMAALLSLLARSATGQALTVYTQFLGGPGNGEETGGPAERHVVLLDNGRTNLLGGRYREMLRCIRCGACLNVCPVYRAVSGHGYDSVYPGPMGAILSPLLGGEETRARYANLPKASSLCGSCEEVCPVAIPIPKMLLALREESHRDNLPGPKGAPAWGPWSFLSVRPRLWRLALGLLHRFGPGPVGRTPSAPIRHWRKYHDLPARPAQSFRSWWRERPGKGGRQ